MDLAVARRNRNRAIAAALPLDYHRLIARLAAEQAASPTGRIAALASAGQTQAQRPFDALVGIFDPLPAGQAWPRILGGSFCPRFGTSDRGNSPSTNMNVAFTLPF